MDRMIWAWAAALGFLLDWVLGDPQFLYHPVRLIGWLIGRLEAVLRKICKKTEKGLLLGGLFLVAAVCAGIHRVGDEDNGQNDAEDDCRQGVDLGADLFAGHRVDCDGQCLHRAGVEVGNHEVINGVGQAN